MNPTFICRSYFTEKMIKGIEFLPHTQIFKSLYLCKLTFDILNLYFFVCNITHDLKYLRSTTLVSKDIGIKKSVFVAKTQFFNVNVDISKSIY